MLDYEKISLHWVNRLSFLARKVLASRFQQAGFDISPEEWAILLVLWKSGPQSPGLLADVTVKDRTTVTRLIDAMVRKGLAERSEDGRDRRRNVISASHYAVSIKHDLIGIAGTVIAESTAGIADNDIETMTRTLRTMTGNLLDIRGHTSQERKEK